MLKIQRQNNYFVFRHAKTLLKKLSGGKQTEIMDGLFWHALLLAKCT